jgi:hypothetical protein
VRLAGRHLLPGSGSCSIFEHMYDRTYDRLVVADADADADAGCRLPAPAVRLTSRGRLVMFAVLLMLVLSVLFMLLDGSSVATGEAGVPEPTTVIMVESGQTLWDIAAAIAADGETPEMMQRIEQLNALDSSMLLAGQRLRVPKG